MNDYYLLFIELMLLSCEKVRKFDEKLKLREHEYSMFTQDEIDIISGVSERKMISSDSILGKVFGVFRLYE